MSPQQKDGTAPHACGRSEVVDLLDIHQPGPLPRLASFLLPPPTLQVEVRSGDHRRIASAKVRGEWLRFVRGLKTNRSMLGESEDLYEFLFGSERGSLEPYADVLREV